MLRYLFLLLVFFGAIESSLYSQTRFGGPAYIAGIADDSPDQLLSKAKALDEKQVPEKDDLGSVILELKEIYSELGPITSRASSIRVDRTREDALKRASDGLVRVVGEIEDLDCGDSAGQDKAREFVRVHGELNDVTRGISPFDFDTNNSDICGSVKASIRSAGVGAVEGWVRPDLDGFANEAQLSSAYSTYLLALKRREGTLSDILRKAVEDQSLTSEFILFIVAFGVLALGIIFIVSRFFSQEIQNEWVGSGQITQFVTVMILLTVITMLGLSRILNTDTIGTLLGGVAGYVLAQGVGRAAAKDALKQIAQVVPAPVVGPANQVPVNQAQEGG